MKNHKKIILLSLLIFLFFVYANVDLSFSFMGSALVGLLFIFLVFVALVFLVIFFIQKKKQNLIIFGALFASLFFSVVAWNLIGELELKKSQETGETIIEAIEEYKKQEGTYPNSLTELVPQYLKYIPQPTVGLINKQKFFYGKSENDEYFWLGFPYAAWTLCQYSSDSKEWIVDD